MNIDPKILIAKAQAAGAPEPRTPIQWIKMETWDKDPVPQRPWLIRDRIPRRQPTLLSGEGAVGKSLLVLHLLASTALGRDWLGLLPDPGPAWYIGAEDETDELHIRTKEIARYYGVTYTDLVDEGFRMMSLCGEDAVLGAPNRHGIIEATDLFDQIYEQAGDIKPRCIALDASADVFAGNEIDRAQTRQFVSLLRKLAGVCDGSVILLSHPSLTGISSGTGLSGSTAWHNSVRARMYLTSAKAEQGEQPDSDLRELVFKKNQYGKIGDSVILRYQNGLFLPEKGLSSIEMAAAEQTADSLFLALLAQYANSGRNVSHKERANNFAPRAFAGEPEAKKLTKPLRALTDAMGRLFTANRIHVEQYGRHSNERLAIGPPQKVEP
jgi:RecA-family ATPase